MKNRLYKFIFVLFTYLIFISALNANENFIFNITEIDITQKEI